MGPIEDIGTAQGLIDYLTKLIEDGLPPTADVLLAVDDRHAGYLRTATESRPLETVYLHTVPREKIVR